VTEPRPRFVDRVRGMTFACNIDGRGRTFRLVVGVLLVLAGSLLLLVWALPTGSVLAYLVAIPMILGGAFSIFEARAGWCVVRSLGYRSPI
jgi:uncharacterized membrane protein HdeD (DUF308 family)